MTPFPLSYDFGIDCEVGCVETDPNPNAPGVFVGSGVTPQLCFYADYTDGDQDQLGDFCEEELAAAFAPQLYYFNGDNVGREPRWVATITNYNGTDMVFVGYLHSYYRDEGSSAGWACQVPPFSDDCSGHNGDSEAIFLIVYYNASTQHWVLDHALYSQHESYGFYHRGSSAYPTQLYYPSRSGGYPRAYVSQGKHANYANLSECNSGGRLGTDTCVDVNTAARLPGGSWLNIGSRAVHTTSQDCVTTSNPLHPYYGSGRTECYWTDQPFRGWYPTSVGGSSSSSYSSRLANSGL